MLLCFGSSSFKNVLPSFFLWRISRRLWIWEFNHWLVWMKVSCVQNRWYKQDSNEDGKWMWECDPKRRRDFLLGLIRRTKRLISRMKDGGREEASRDWQGWEERSRKGSNSPTQWSLAYSLAYSLKYFPYTNTTEYVFDVYKHVGIVYNIMPCLHTNIPKCMFVCVLCGRPNGVARFR